MYIKKNNDICIQEDNIGYFLLRCEDIIDDGLIKADTAIGLLLELTSTEEEPQSNIDIIIYEWVNHINEKYRNKSMKTQLIFKKS